MCYVQAGGSVAEYITGARAVLMPLCLPGFGFRSGHRCARFSRALLGGRFCRRFYLGFAFELLS